MKFLFVLLSFAMLSSFTGKVNTKALYSISISGNVDTVNGKYLHFDISSDIGDAFFYLERKPSVGGHYKAQFAFSIWSFYPDQNYFVPEANKTYFYRVRAEAINGDANSPIIYSNEVEL